MLLSLIDKGIFFYNITTLCIYGNACALHL